MEVYSKKPLTIPEQLFLLQARGVTVEDTAFAELVLSNVSYYRFSAYLYPYRRKNGEDGYELGTSFQKCWQLYHFDRRLRLCVLDAVERVEVAVKTGIVNTLATKYGPFAYRDPSFLANNLKTDRFKDLLHFVDEETQKSKEEFVNHFRTKYDSQNGLPLWMAAEVMTFGNMLTLFRLMKKQDKNTIAKTFGSNEQIFESWLVHLNYIRNICAHHGRLWNRYMALKAIMPLKDPRWKETNYPVNPNTIYSTLCIFKTLLDVVAPQSRWKHRFYALLKEFPDIPRTSMGIPNGFEQSALWK